MIVDGTSYSDRTPEEVVRVLERLRQSRERVAMYYGEPGRLWGDVEVGMIGRSTGTNKIPLCTHNTRSWGGEAILDDCIMGIRHANRKNGGWLYRHPSLKQKLTDLKTSHTACEVKEDEHESAGA